MNKFSATILIASFLLFAPAAVAIDTGFLTFDLDDSWLCTKNSKNWMCKPKKEGDKTQAIIVISAKVVGPEDNLAIFEKHLKQEKILTTANSPSPITSEVLKVSRRTIGPQEWVEALHYQSEVPGFFTLYLATRSGKLSILVTLSAAKNQIKKFNEHFVEMVQTLRIKSDFIIQLENQVKNQSTAISTMPKQQKMSEPTETQHRLKFMLIGALIALGGAIAYFLYQRKSL